MTSTTSTTDAPGAVIRTMLDTDLYKLTMQQAVWLGYPNAEVSYWFTNRSPAMKFTQAAVDQIQVAINALESLQLTQEERAYLEQACPYLQPAYLDFLQQFRYDPKTQVQLNPTPITRTVTRSDGSTYEEEGWLDLHLTVTGKWHDVILYEVPLMAIISEVYFRVVDTDWSLEGQEALAAAKSKKLIQHGIKYSEFGTRRRRSYKVQELVVKGLCEGVEQAKAAGPLGGTESLGALVGTSNVHLSRIYGIPPSGTVAHEWTMAIAALEGYRRVNLTSAEKWDAVYSPPNFYPRTPAEDLTIALTDTFSTSVFWKDLLDPLPGDRTPPSTGDSDAADLKRGREIIRRWKGVRQDSGDSYAFARKAKQAYESLGIDPKTKVIVFSDGLNVDKTLALASYAREIGIGSAFGLGTNLTNDFVRASDPSQKSKALNIVIKLRSLNGQPVVKISDELTKNTGDAEEVKLVKRRFGLETTADTDQIEDA